MPEEHGRKFKNINLEAAYIHIISDIILSIGVIISAIIIFVWAEDTWTPIQLADPFCTYIFSFMAIYTTVPILKESSIMLLDGYSKPELVQQIKEELDKRK